MIEVANDEEVKKRFAIKSSAAELLSSYTRFVSEFYGKPVKEDSIVEGLIAKLAKDKAWMKWQQEKTRKNSSAESS